MDIIFELNKFSDIKYFDEPHKYFIDNRELVSATTFIGKFKEKFDTENIAESYANKRGLDVKDVINEWDLKRDISTVKGTLIHNYAENYWYNKVFPYDAVPVIRKFGSDIIKEKFEKCVNNFKLFYKDAVKNLIPVKMEFVVGDTDYGIAGMVDCLFYNKKSQMLEIYDYKTNKEIKKSNQYKQKFKNPISHLDYCELNTYSLQLGLYKHIIEKNTNLKLGNLYLVWINEINDTYKIIPCKDLQAELMLMLETSNKK
jgi:ATP-dependent exoDNAse (exonuclease V) beta subunit